MHKDGCIWGEPNRCNCGWLQDIAKNPREAVREIEHLRAELAECRNALTDMLSGWIYIRQTHGDLYGVGWDRAQRKAENALARKGEGET